MIQKRAFTLIELLVVIAIIAILAAILFPVFAQAKAAAKKTQAMSQMKQLGVAIEMYLTDADDTYMQAYYYPNDNNSSGGYTQWSGLIYPYTKNWRVFIDPADKNGGLAPTNFIGDNLGFGVPPGQVAQYNIQDLQAPRLSYIANGLLLPRKRRTVDPMNVIPQSAVDGIAETILIAPMTDIIPCINDTSGASGQAYKTHRSMNAIKMLDGSAFAGENQNQIGKDYYAVTNVEAEQTFDKCAKDSANGLFHIAYIARANRHQGGAVYIYADTHAKFEKLAKTLDPQRWQWGKRAYTAGGGKIFKSGTSEEVQ